MTTVKILTFLELGKMNHGWMDTKYSMVFIESKNFYVVHAGCLISLWKQARAVMSAGVNLG